MELSNNVKVKSKLWDLIPWISNKTAQAIYPNIYLPKFVYSDLISDSPSVWNVALLKHEQEHIKRQKEAGIFIWSLKYIFSPKFRFEEELKADVSKLKFLKSKKANPYIDKRAKHLSGWNYFWPVSYKEARARLMNIWTELN